MLTVKNSAGGNFSITDAVGIYAFGDQPIPSKTFVQFSDDIELSTDIQVNMFEDTPSYMDNQSSYYSFGGVSSNNSVFFAENYFASYECVYIGNRRLLCVASDRTIMHFFILELSEDFRSINRVVSNLDLPFNPYRNTAHRLTKIRDDKLLLFITNNSGEDAILYVIDIHGDEITLTNSTYIPPVTRYYTNCCAIYYYEGRIIFRGTSNNGTIATEMFYLYLNEDTNVITASDVICGVPCINTGTSNIIQRPLYIDDDTFIMCFYQDIYRLDLTDDSITATRLCRYDSSTYAFSGFLYKDELGRIVVSTPKRDSSTIYHGMNVITLHPDTADLREPKSDKHQQLAKSNSYDLSLMQNIEPERSLHYVVMIHDGGTSSQPTSRCVKLAATNRQMTKTYTWQDTTQELTPNSSYKKQAIQVYNITESGKNIDLAIAGVNTTTSPYKTNFVLYSYIPTVYDKVKRVHDDMDGILTTPVDENTIGKVQFERTQWEKIHDYSY